MTALHELASIGRRALLSAAADSGDGGGGGGDCRLLGPFALVVQGALGGLALLSLVFKRYRERPQRPLLIWWFDVSKQLFGSVLVHIANLFMSMLSAGEFKSDYLSPAAQAVDTGPSHPAENYQPNPCSFYLLNLAIDTTLGIPILIGLLHLLHRGALHTALGDPPESLQSGYYGPTPRWTWWFKQSLIYFLGLLGMKFCVLIIFSVFPFIVRAGDWALRWTEGDERVQVFFVMLFFPLIMNAIQYWIIDGFIKRSNDSKEISQEEPNEGEDAEGEEQSLMSDADEEADGKHDSSAKRNGDHSENPNIRKRSPGPYDPTTTDRATRADGEDTPNTIIGSAKDDENSHKLRRLASEEDVRERSPPRGPDGRQSVS